MSHLPGETGVRALQMALCLSTVRVYFAGMSRKKPISLTAVNLKTGAPEIGTSDLTELRRLSREFPKDDGERECYKYLLRLMKAEPQLPPKTKAELKETCRRKFRVTVDCFEYCWREAIKVTGAAWDKPGRRPGRRSS